MAMTDEERKAKRRAYEKTPKRKEQVRATQRAYAMTEKGKAKIKRHRSTEVSQERSRANLPDYGAHLATWTNGNRAWMLEESPENVAQEYIDWHN